MANINEHDRRSLPFEMKYRKLHIILDGPIAYPKL